MSRKTCSVHNIYDYQGNFLLDSLDAYSISSNIKDLKNAIKNEIERKSQIKKIGRIFYKKEFISIKTFLLLIKLLQG